MLFSPLNYDLAGLGMFKSMCSQHLKNFFFLYFLFIIFLAGEIFHIKSLSNWNYKIIT